MTTRAETAHVDAYAVNKLAAHPDVLREFRETGHTQRLISVHLMPTNSCSHRCEHCSYRLVFDDGVANKNASAFDDTKQIPWPAMSALLDDFAALGVQGVEVTGGGEPLSYRHRARLWSALARHGFATALVTNGTLLTPDLAALISIRLKWARVSIDAGESETYQRVHGVEAAEFKRAWNAVMLLREHAPSDPEFRLGVSFVLDNLNAAEIRSFAHLAREHGADNVRLSATYSDRHLGFFTDLDAIRRAEEESLAVEADFNTRDFRVHNLIPPRLWEIEHPAQDYRRCATKDVLCVVEGEGKVFTCCTFTGSPKGMQGNILEHPRGFRGIWEDNAEWRRSFDASIYCDVTCLYRDRNLAMNELIDAPTMTPAQDHVHSEFI